MIYSKQKWFCNNCGKEQYSQMVPGSKHGPIGAEFKCCTVECHNNIELKRAKSILGKE